jgi:uncharacterized protein (DUF2141 family)
MKTNILFTFVIMAFTLSAHALTLEVSQFRGRSGNLMIAVFDDPGQFPDKKPSLTKIIAVEDSQQLISVDLDLPPGDYAISTFLDANKNGKLDTNILGIPKELFGFSNNPRILTGAPSFQDCEVRVGTNPQITKIGLIKIF